MSDEALLSNKATMPTSGPSKASNLQLHELAETLMALLLGPIAQAAVQI